MAIDRTKKQRRKAARAMFKRLLAAFGFIMLILSSLYFYNHLTRAEWLTVDEIQLDGVYRVDPAELERLLADIRGQNILLVSIDLYTKRIANHPRVKRASLKRVLPNRLFCTVEEREPVALVFIGRFLEVDRDGIILGEDDLTRLLDLPIITGISGEVVTSGKVCKDKRLRDALDALEYCKRFGGRFAENISEIKIGGRGITIISLEENSTLLLGDTDYKNRLKKYFLLEKSISDDDRSTKLIDLRFDDQVVLRNKL